MRKIITILILSLVPAVGTIAAGPEDGLLTGDGTLFLVRSIAPREAPLEVDTSSQSVLLLTTIHHGVKTSFVVPGTLRGGSNIEPVLEWDESDSRLYLFWQRMPSITSSELVVTSFKDGVWGNESSFGSGLWTWRMNLRLALTHRLQQETADGAIEEVEGLTVHAVWWNQDHGVESAMYAALTLDGGQVIAHPPRQLTSFVGELSSDLIDLPEDFNDDVLRSPFLLTTVNSATVDVVFADWLTANLYLVTLTPRNTQDGRLRIPVGIASEGMHPPILHRPVDALEISRPMRHGANFVIYSIGDDEVEYVRYLDGAPEAARNLPLDGDLTQERARSAVERLAGSR